MPLPSFTHKKHELLATAVTLVFAFSSLKTIFFLPAFREMFSNSDIDPPRLTALVFGFSGTVTVVIMAVTAITLWAVWTRHRLGGLVAAVGIICLGITTQLLWSAAISPIVRMINTMGNQ